VCEHVTKAAAALRVQMQPDDSYATSQASGASNQQCSSRWQLSLESSVHQLDGVGGVRQLTNSWPADPDFCLPAVTVVR
jgi:hypothetical protein